MFKDILASVAILTIAAVLAAAGVHLYKGRHYAKKGYQPRHSLALATRTRDLIWSDRLGYSLQVAC